MSDYLSHHRTAELVDATLKGRMFRGLAAVFDAPWSDRLTQEAGYQEVVKRGAFRKALSNGDNIPFLLEHDRHQVLGTTRSGNVKIEEDARGLAVEAKLPDNSLGEYARTMIESGDLHGMSYGLVFNKQRDVKMLRVAGQIPKVLVVGAKRLLDVSLTWDPAYDTTSVDLRSRSFVAPPLQEYLDGTETQIEEAAAEESPGEEEPAAWLPDGEAEAAPVQEPVPYWERLARQIEREM